MSTGKLKWYNGAKGFDPKDDDGGKDVFVPVTAFKEANITKVDPSKPLSMKLKSIMANQLLLD